MPTPTGPRALALPPGVSPGGLRAPCLTSADISWQLPPASALCAPRTFMLCLPKSFYSPYVLAASSLVLVAGDPEGRSVHWQNSEQGDSSPTGMELIQLFLK